jgi:hypothetical protein
MSRAAPPGNREGGTRQGPAEFLLYTTDSRRVDHGSIDCKSDANHKSGLTPRERELMPRSANPFKGRRDRQDA